MRCRLILGFSAGDVFSLAALQFLEPEFELLDLAADPLRRPAKLHSPQLGDLEFQLLDLQRLELHRRLCRLQLALTGQREDTQFGGIVRQIGRGERHAIIYRDRSCRTRTNTESVLCQTSIGRIGNAGAIVRRQSIASIRYRKLRGGERHRTIDDGWPDKATFLKSLGDQPKPAAVPIERLEVVTTARFIVHPSRQIPGSRMILSY